MYVPAFFETFLVMLVAVAVILWVRRRSPAAGTLIGGMVAGVALSTLWGAAAVYSERFSTVAAARYAAMGFALAGLLAGLGWGLAVRGRPVEGDE